MLESMGKGKFRIGDLPSVLIHETQLAAFRLGAEHNIRLVDLLKSLQIRTHGARLHNGGNDVHFTLRALLMLAASSCNLEVLNKNQRDRKELLKAVVGMPIRLHQCLSIISRAVQQTEMLERSHTGLSPSRD
jgi:hypothetical protein